MQVESNGTSIHYELHGQESAPVLVFSHALSASLGMWSPQLEPFAQNYRVLLYDTRGHGNSSLGHVAEASVEMLGKDLLGLLDALTIDRVHFCGLSLGGFTGQWLGIHAAHRLLSLTLANTGKQIGVAETWNARMALVLREGMAPIIPGTLERWFTADFRASHPETVAAIEALMQKTDPAGYAACCAAVRDADFRETANKIAVPTLLIAGTHDPTTTPADLQALHKAIRGSKYAELAAGHISSVEAAATFNQALAGFLDSLR